MEDYDNQQTLYDQVVSQMQDQIALFMQPGDKMNSERLLAEKYHVSRSTIRQALDELESLGYLYRKNNGLYVSDEQRHTYDFSATSWSKQVRKSHKVPHVQVIYFRDIAANRYLSQQMGVEVGPPLYKIKRIRYANDTPMIVEWNIFQQATVPNLNAQSLNDVSLYHLLREQYGIQVDSIDDEVNAALVRNNSARDLKVANYSLALHFFRKTYDTHKRIIMFTNGYTRGDHFILHLHHDHYDY